MNQLRQKIVVMTGPLPPAVGGMASVLGALSDSSLPKRVKLELFETGKTTPDNRPFVVGVVNRLNLLWRWWKIIGHASHPIAHIHTCSGFTFFLDGVLLILAKIRGASTVLHIHGARFDSFLDNLGFVKKWIVHWLTTQADVVVVLSEDWKVRLSERLPEANLKVVANGVPRLPGTRKNANSTAPTFLFLGNLCRRKGVDILLEATEKSQTAWKLELAGGEEEPGFSSWTQDQIAQRKLANRVSLLGPVVGEAKNKLLKEADGFVLPSLAEGLPMALLEAMAAQLPVVVTRVGAMPEVIDDNINGILIPPQDANALASALDQLALNPQLREQLGQVAAETCELRYGIERMVDALSTIYDNLHTGKRI
ncbi:MAG: putative Glycosyl transferase group 1 [Proteobacteria bacterium]|nr:putative Glycosyl transferase group 1 [Pseudomonadota bacterium]